eukprot:6183286-Pleurochrysis_carterae.AAC.1
MGQRLQPLFSPPIMSVPPVGQPALIVSERMQLIPLSCPISSWTCFFHSRLCLLFTAISRLLRQWAAIHRLVWSSLHACWLFALFPRRRYIRSFSSRLTRDPSSFTCACNTRLRFGKM